MNNFYITTPIYYVNDAPHIGHAYTSLSCDVIARFMRLNNCNVKFITGTDEHGQKVEKSAQKINIPTQEFVDQVSNKFKDLCTTMNFEYNDFIRTTEERHKLSAQSLWKILEEKGEIYLDKYSGWYSIRDEAFYAADEINDGLSPTGSSVEWVEEDSYFFRLSKWQDKLIELYNNNPDFIAPEIRKNEVMSFVESGLKDLSISRTSFNWGVKIPNNEKHVMYVWIDALSNYLTALDFPHQDSEDYINFWSKGHKHSINNATYPSNNAVHIVGKDILRFHAIYWPALLMAAGLPVPKRIFAHGWWTNAGEKISKSLGNTIDPIKIVDEFGLDNVRYFLLRNMVFGNDGNFTKSALQRIVNTELVNNIGNLLQRTLAFIYKNCNGVIPMPEHSLTDSESQNYRLDDVYNKLSKESRTLISHIDFSKHIISSNDINIYIIGTADEIIYRDYMLNQNFISFEENKDGEQIFSGALGYIIQRSKNMNKYIDSNAPWQLRKSDLKKMNEVLYVICEHLRIIGIMLQPFVPDSANKILNLLNIKEEERHIEHTTDKYNLGGNEILEPFPIFKKIEIE